MDVSLIIYIILQVVPTLCIALYGKPGDNNDPHFDFWVMNVIVVQTHCKKMFLCTMRVNHVKTLHIFNKQSSEQCIIFLSPWPLGSRDKPNKQTYNVLITELVELAWLRTSIVSKFIRGYKKEKTHNGSICTNNFWIKYSATTR